MLRKVDREGYVEIDHRESPGISHEEAARVGSRLAVGKGQRFQAATWKCCGCERQIILLKEQARHENYCSQCDSYMCDECLLRRKVTGIHIPFWKRAEDFMRAMARVNG